MRKQLAGVALAMALVIGGQGCYGGFALTRKLHKGIGGVKDKIVRELAYLGCVIIPVYGVTAFVDFWIFNTIEFWSGKNPVTSATRSFVDGDTQMVMKLDREGKANLYLFEKGSLVDRVTMTRREDGALVAAGRNGLAWTAKASDDGVVTVTDAAGGVRTFGADGLRIGTN